MHVFGEKILFIGNCLQVESGVGLSFLMKGTRYSIGLDMLVFTMVTDTMREKPLSVWKV